VALRDIYTDPELSVESGWLKAWFTWLHHMLFKHTRQDQHCISVFKAFEIVTYDGLAS